MNCQDHLYRNADPRQVTRRWFLEQCGVGLGRSRWASCCKPRAMRRRRREARGRQSAGAEGAASCGQGQAGDVPVHGGRAQPSRAVRLQAAAGEVRRHAAAGRAAQGLPGRVHQSRAPSCSGPKFKFARHGQSGTELSELLPHLATVVDDIAIVKGMVTDAFNHAPGPDHDEHRLADLRPAEHGRLGRLRPGQRVAGPARLRRLQHRQEGAQRRQFELGQRLPADGLPGRPVPHQRRSGPVSLQPARRRSRHCSATRSTRSASSTSCGSTRSAIPRSPPGSTRSRWPSACSLSAPT